MIKLHYKSANGDEKTVEVEAGSKDSLLDVALSNKIELDHACGGNAACSTCHVKVKQGMEHLNEIDDIEEDLIDFAEDADLNSRLACQCIPNTDKVEITIHIPEQKGLH